ncbi:transcriptional regulator, IclR family [Beutenbergia cavernae DSM 12333]|uniref:Transcriptional regulator, IclR family n=1 Tax=Beutenbergia cavernae (strain ATCC BAA-8 / DSM 12333 / CCUG 43141 / JCM 11478 / NBRC 16432 / NCIMB 13614 / HKI 0122) TaxID=471853 RepID=C5BZP6_BEUC1|nr:IclR family transcriptional regulator [Beutenbergia cavernae]ACQ81226.1 transcriptional regulator, IclR family [Beutenbergia cavernae DSM 12333]
MTDAQPDAPALSAQNTGFQGIDRMVAIVDGVREAQPATLAQVARASGLSEPTALRYLHALRDHRIVRRDPETGAYTLGMRLYEWGESAEGAYDPIQAAGPLLERLVDEHGETVELAGLESGGRLIVLDARPGTHGISKTARVGDDEEWHATSVGKALLAAMPIAQSDALIRGVRLRRFTENSLTSVANLQRDLELSRQRGYSIDNEESEIGLRCVGVAARDRNGDPAFAFSVSGPSYRMTDTAIPQIAQSLARAAAQLERGWGLTPRAPEPADDQPVQHDAKEQL